MDYKELEDLLSSLIKTYELGFNEFNKDQEIKFTLTCTQHHVEVQELKKWVAYLRLERMIRPKGGTDEEWESLLVYNQAYKFKDAGERANPEAPWKRDLYMDLFQRLVAAGLEYSELLKRMQGWAKENKGKPIANLVLPEKPDIVVTDQMPKPLTDDEKQYKQWVEKNREVGS